MNGIHDLGGTHGFGPVVAEPDEPVFHTPWERRVFALALAMGFHGRWNLDMTRHAREQMPPAEYLATTYYEHWLFGLERQLVEHGFVTAAELDARDSRPGGDRPPAAALAPTTLRPADIERRLRKRIAARVDAPVPARFHAGQAVRARNLHPVGHTRLPRYVRGRRGVIDRDHGVFAFPDARAAGRGKAPQHVYSVAFSARELWGPEAPPRDRVYVDLWDDYLEPAS